MLLIEIALNEIVSEICVIVLNTLATLSPRDIDCDRLLVAIS